MFRTREVSDSAALAGSSDRHRLDVRPSPPLLRLGYAS